MGRLKVLCITIEKELFEKLKEKVGKGNISAFIRTVVERELEEKETNQAQS